MASEDGGGNFKPVWMKNNTLHMAINTFSHATVANPTQGNDSFNGICWCKDGTPNHHKTMSPVDISSVNYCNRLFNSLIKITNPHPKPFYRKTARIIF